MELTYNGSFGHAPGKPVMVRGHAYPVSDRDAEAVLGGQLRWEALIARSFPSQEQKEAMVLAAYPQLRGDPLYDPSARG